ncbi:NAD(+) synthase [Flavobacteriales bacterium]|nr:NAD(+) synthase [Flavobacteriales bacterium]
MRTKECTEYICNWLSSYLNTSKSKGFVIGVSGGIDSAVTSTLAAKTGVPVLCLEMPIHQQKEQVTRANQHINWLKSTYPNVSSACVDLSGIYDQFVETVSIDESLENHMISLVNSRARIRMTTLYYYAQLHSYLVVGTGNKVEDFGIGFYTKYGDGGVDISPIADLLKTEVFALGKELGVNDDILTAAPTDGLWGDNRSDEDQIGATYAELEWAMSFDGLPSELNKRQQNVLDIYTRLNAANTHKMIPIPVCKIPNDLK